MIVGSPAPNFPVGRNVDLTAHQGLDASLPGFLVELDRPVHHTVVGQGKPWHPLFFGESDKIPDTASPVEHRELRVTVQMRKSATRRNRQSASLSLGLRRRPNGTPPL